MTHEQRARRRREIAWYIRNGNTVSDACRLFEVTSKTVERCCREFKVKITSDLPIAPTTMGIIARLLNTEDSLSRIASDNSITCQAVSQIYHRCIEAGIRVHVRKSGPNSR